MTGVRPTTLAYVSGPTEQALHDQREVVTEHAAAEGLTLERIVTDRSDMLTIIQLVATARACDARVVIGRSHPAAPQRVRRLATDPPRQRQAVPA
jgi:hypothetical protein